MIGASDSDLEIARTRLVESDISTYSRKNSLFINSFFKSVRIDRIIFQIY